MVINNQISLRPDSGAGTLEAWGDFVSRRICPFEFDNAGDEPFAVDAYMATVDGFGLARFDTQGGVSQLRRTFRSIQRRAAEFYAVYAPIQGTQAISQFGREHLCVPGSLTLVDPDEHYRQHKLGNNLTSYFFIPKSSLEERLINPQDVCVRPANFGDGIGRVTHDFLHSLVSQASHLSEIEFRRLSRQLMDLVCLSFARPIDREADEPALRLANRQQVKKYIRKHLTAPTLGPQRIARDLGVSVRYLHKLFSTEAGSLCDYIRQERLELARRMLLDPQQADRSVTDIAYACGFSTSAHFSSSFRAAFGESPRTARSAPVLTPA